MNGELQLISGEALHDWLWSEMAQPGARSELQGEGKKLPKISIVVPNYNYGQYLEETLRSVLLQDYPALELIVIDGGSTDNSLEIIKKYEKHISYWVSEPDKGQAHAINKGFRQARGEVFAWLNSSDLYLPETLQRVGDIFFAHCDIEWITSRFPGHLWGGWRTSAAPHRKGYSKRLFKLGGYLGEAPFSLGCMQQESTFWRASLWHKAGGELNESLKAALDFDLWARFLRHVSPVVVDKPLSLFRVHEGQISSSHKVSYVEEGLASLGYVEGNEPGLAKVHRVLSPLGLVKLVGWQNICGLLYGETARMLLQSDDGSWRVKMLSRLRLNYRGV